MIRPANKPEAHVHDPLDEKLIDRLADYDERLRAGGLNDTDDEANWDAATPADLRSTLQELELIWPRNGSAEPATPEQSRIGRFVIERTLGQGGYGIVYLALDPALGRHVALKVPRLHALADSGLLERFRREARAAAALDHPHIVPVHETGQIGQVYYIASAYCPGSNLAQWLRQQSRPVAPSTAARIVACLADAVHYSHTRGVLHRDIKPGNVLLAPQPSEHSDDRLPFIPRLTDFGLAKLVEQGLAAATLQPQAMTATDQMIGTPAYMAPEQAGFANSSAIGPASDVYSLGAVLYELLTGRPPFQGAHVADVLNQVVTADPRPIRRLRRDVPRDLETICLKCLQKEPQHRYFSAQQLADDLDNFLHDRPIAARPPGNLAATAKWVRRRPAVAALIAVVFVSLTGIAVQRSLHVTTVDGLNASLRQTNDELKDALATARASESAAQASAHDARNLAYASDMNNAWRAREEGDFVEFMNILDRYDDGTPLADHRGVEWYYLAGVDHTIRSELHSVQQPVYALAFTPDRNQIAIAGQDHLVRLINPSSGTIVREFAVEQGDINSVAFSTDLKTIATAAENGAVCWCDFETLQLKHRVIAHSEGACEVVCYTGPDATDIRWATSGRDPVIRLWRGTEPCGMLEHHTAAVEELLVHPDGRRLISLSSGDKTVCIWDLAVGRLLHELKPGTGKMRDVSLSADGRFLATCSDVVQVWDCQDGALLTTHRPLDPPERVCFAYVPLMLCIADKAGRLTSLKMEGDRVGELVGLNVGQTWEAHTGRIYALERNPRTRELVSAGKDGRVVSWKRAGASKVESFEIEHAGLSDIAFDTQREQMLTAALGGVRFWNYKDQSTLSSELAIAPPFHHCGCIAISQAADLFAAGTETVPFVHVWRLSDRTLQRTIALPTGDDVVDLSFSRDGSMLAAVSAHTLFLISADTGDIRETIPLGDGIAAVFSPTESDLVYLQPTTHTVRCTNWKTGQVVFETLEVPERPSIIVFSPDGRQMLTGGRERFVRVWDAQTGAFLRNLQGHRFVVEDFSVSPDSRTVAGIDANGEIKFWHLASGKFLMDSHLSPGTLRDWLCRFSPDGNWLVAMRDADAATLVPLKPNTALIKAPVPDAPDSPDSLLPTVAAASTPVPVFIDFGEINDIRDLEFSPDGQMLAVMDAPETSPVATLLDVRSQAVRQHLQLPDFKGHAVVHFNANGTRLYATVRRDDGLQTLAHWNLESGEGRIARAIYNVGDFMPSPLDVDKVVVGHRVNLKRNQAQVSLWNCATDQIEQVLRSMQGEINTVAVSRDGRRVFNETTDAVPAVIDMESRSSLEFADESLGTRWGAFDPSGHHVAASLHKGLLVLFDVKLGRPVESFRRPFSPRFDRLEYSPDGRFLAFRFVSGLPRSKVMVWDSTLKRCLYVLPVEGHGVTGVAWSPDGRTLAAGLYRDDDSPGPDVALWTFTDEQLTLP